MVKKEIIKWIKDRESLGPVYDWQKIKINFSKLKIPRGVFNPLTAPIDKASILCYVSKRSKGKTTNWLLFGLVMYLMYGTNICYVRTDKAMIKPSIVNEIFNTIKTYNNGKYIRDMTGGRYNNIYYHWGKCYLCHIDEESGKRDDTDSKPFFYFLSIDQHIDYKSGLNIPLGDLIILDEFIEKHSYMDDFPSFWDLFKTIQRDRQSPKIIMLANTTDPNNMWFKELLISKEAKSIKPGEHKLVNVNGTPIYLEYIDITLTSTIKETVSLFFGFAKGNPRMAHLVETEAAWTFNPVPHIVMEEDDKYLDRTLRIQANELESIQIDLVAKKDGRIVVYAHPCTQHYDDSIFLTLADVNKANEIWGLGLYNNYCKYIWELYRRNLWYFSDNETGALIDNYVRNARQLSR